MSKFQVGKITQADLNKLADGYKAIADFHKSITPKYIKVNNDYWNKFIKENNVQMVSFSPDGTTVDFKGIVPFHGIPVVIDNLIDTYEFVYE